jgi:hypothetical protein
MNWDFGRGIGELQPKNNRIRYFHHRGNTYVLLHPFRKKTQKTSSTKLRRTESNATIGFPERGDTGMTTWTSTILLPVQTHQGGEPSDRKRPLTREANGEQAKQWRTRKIVIHKVFHAHQANSFRFQSVSPPSVLASLETHSQPM